MYPGAFRYELLNFRCDAAQEAGRRRPRPATRVAGKDASQIIVKISRPFKSILLAFALVMLAQGYSDLRKSFDLAAQTISWPRAGNLIQKLVDIFQLPQCRPAAIAPPPVRPRL